MKSTMADPTNKVGVHNNKGGGGKKGYTYAEGRARKGTSAMVHICFPQADYQEIKRRADAMAVHLGFPISPRAYLMHVLKYAPTTHVQEYEQP